MVWVRIRVVYVYDVMLDLMISPRSALILSRGELVRAVHNYYQVSKMQDKDIIMLTKTK